MISHQIHCMYSVSPKLRQNVEEGLFGIQLVGTVRDAFESRLLVCKHCIVLISYSATFEE